MDERFSGRMRIMFNAAAAFGPALVPLPAEVPREQGLEELRRKFSGLRVYTLDEWRAAFDPRAPLLWEGDQA